MIGIFNLDEHLTGFPKKSLSSRPSAYAMLPVRVGKTVRVA
jgi:hypothetical protein